MKLIIKSKRSVLELTELFKVIKNLNQYCTFICKEDDIFIQIMDDSHVCLLETIINKEWFDTFECSNQTISFNSNTFVKILNLYTPNSFVEITVFQEQYLELSLIYEDNTNKSFQIPLIDIDQELLKTQEIECNLEFTIKPKIFEKYINELALFGENMELICCNDNLFMKSFGDEGKYSIKIPHENLNDFIVDEELKLKTKICLKYLTYITKFSCVFDKSYIKIQKDAPFYFELYRENEDNNKIIYVKYFIAPKVEDDEDNNFSEYE